MKTYKDTSSWSPRRQRASYRTPDVYIKESMDMINQWNETYTAPLMDSWNQMMETIMEPWMRGPAYAYRKKPCGCHDGCKCDSDCCQHDHCDCQCCVADADLLVRARAGERRLVPITIENTYRREREVELELSSWTAASDAAVAVKGALVGPTRFKLAPCEEEVVKIAIEIAVDRDSDNRQQGDVDRCEVVYADLRIKGCDIRPIRIALAILPCHCETYHAGCQCTCC